MAGSATRAARPYTHLWLGSRRPPPQIFSSVDHTETFAQTETDKRHACAGTLMTRSVSSSITLYVFANASYASTIASFWGIATAPKVLCFSRVQSIKAAGDVDKG